MTRTKVCPKDQCGFWGIPLKSLDDLRSLSEKQFQCCLWHESKAKCSRDPRFTNDPDAEDYFDPVAADEFEDEAE